MLFPLFPLHLLKLFPIPAEKLELWNYNILFQTLHLIKNHNLLKLLCFFYRLWTVWVVFILQSHGARLKNYFSL